MDMVVEDRRELGDNLRELEDIIFNTSSTTPTHCMVRKLERESSWGKA